MALMFIHAFHSGEIPLMSQYNSSPVGAIAHIDHSRGNASSIHKSRAEDENASVEIYLLQLFFLAILATV